MGTHQKKMTEIGVYGCDGFFECMWDGNERKYGKSLSRGIDLVNFSSSACSQPHPRIHMDRIPNDRKRQSYTTASL